jgi:hypothetical protein
MAGYVANAASLQEQTGSFVFPSDEELVSSIPLWMKFYCFEYSNTASNRVAAYLRSQNLANVPTLSNLKAQIYVPAPTAFESLTSLQYNRSQTSAGNALPGVLNFLANKAKQSTNPFIKAVVDGVSQIVDDADQASKLLGTIAGGGFGYGQDIPLDLNDLQFIGAGSYRSFDIRLYLPCLSIQDSENAGKIIRTFESLALPTAFSAGGIFATKYFHPPLWVFGIGPVDSMKFDPDWTGYPQLSILQSIKVRKTAVDANSISAFYQNASFKPVAYSISLLFRELEPAVRVVGLGEEVGTTITNRSGVIIGTGTNIAAKVTGQ